MVAESGGELIPLLSPEVLERCRGNVNDLKGRLKFYASSKGLEAPF